ncbi:MAG: choice-of-anchor tandem repeat GloVer-containing protein [Candidatus Korobacteraceae bacterium]
MSRRVVSTSLFILLVAAIAAQAQTFTVLHEFTGGTDGSGPYSTLVMDHSGNLYGIATYGAHSGCGIYPGVGCGIAFKLEHKGTGWVFYPLYGFTGSPDGANPVGSLTIAPDGTLYGTTNDGGAGGDCTDTWGRIGCGTVFHLQPPPNFCASFLCPWTETTLYRFTGGDNGNDPWAGVVLDGAGNLYGTAY